MSGKVVAIIARWPCKPVRAFSTSLRDRSRVHCTPLVLHSMQASGSLRAQLPASVPLAADCAPRSDRRPPAGALSIRNRHRRCSTASAHRHAVSSAGPAAQRDSVSRLRGDGAQLASSWKPPTQALPPTQAVQAPETDAQAPAAELAIDMRGVDVTVGPPGQRKQVLRDCHFAVQSGQLHMLLGANGCGKSTLLRCAGGLLRPGAGSAAITEPVGFVFQNPDHQVVLPTAGADVAFGLGRYDLPESDVGVVVDHCLDVVGLAGFQKRPAHTLSGGERQRLAVAGALAQAPAVLLLDELTSFLDAGDQRSVLSAVRAAVDTGGVTAVWVTHRLDELEWADGASFMEGGRIAVSGSVGRVRCHLRGLGAPV